MQNLELKVKHEEIDKCVRLRFPSVPSHFWQFYIEFWNSTISFQICLKYNLRGVTESMGLNFSLINWKNIWKPIKRNQLDSFEFLVTHIIDISNFEWRNVVDSRFRGQKVKKWKSENYWMADLMLTTVVVRGSHRWMLKNPIRVLQALFL